MAAVVGLLGIGTETLVTIIGGVDPIRRRRDVRRDDRGREPPHRRVERLDDSQMARVGLTATTLTDGSMIVIGGRDPKRLGPPSRSTRSRSMNGAPLRSPGSTTCSRTPRYDHTATRLGDDVGAPALVVGGTRRPPRRDPRGRAVQADHQSVLDMFISDDESAALAAITRFGMTDGSGLILGGIDTSGNPGAND